MNARHVFICAALLLFASGAFAGGIYQRTTDRKTFIWNPDPGPAEAASWSGDRDAGSYATGPGTLTWYRLERKYAIGSRVSHEKHIPVIRYSGNMVRGKLEGPVVTVNTQGETFHATYTNGSRSSEWTPGPPSPGGTGITEHPPLPSDGATGQTDKPVQPPDEPAQQNTVAVPDAGSSPKPQPPTSKSESVREQASKNQLPTSPPDPEQRGDEPVQPPRPSDGATGRKAVAENPAQKPSPPASPIPDQKRRNQPVRREAVVDLPTDGPWIEPSPVPSLLDQPPLIAAATSGATRGANGQVSQGVAVADLERQPIQQISQRPAIRRRGQPSELFQSLTIPPSLLGSRMNLLAPRPPTAASPPAASPQPSIPSTSSSPPPPAVSAPSTSSSPPAEPAPATSSSLSAASPPPSAPSPSPSRPARPRLSTTAVVELANTEARTQGYDPGSCQSLKVDYTAADDTWLVVYDQQPGEGMAEVGKHFSVTVEDKTKKTAVVPGKIQSSDRQRDNRQRDN